VSIIRMGIDDDNTVKITFACGHPGETVKRCAESYRERWCDDCARAKMPQAVECLRELMQKNGDWLGPNLGPIGAVIYVRQCRGFQGIVAWSGLDWMFDALEGVEPTRKITPYIELFEKIELSAAPGLARK